MDVLLSSEVDLYIDTLKCYNIKYIGEKTWLEYHTRVTKLNQQALLEASQLREEYVKESLAASGKIGVLVHEAILISVWKKKVLPLILKFEPSPENTFTIYSVLYHEAICVSLLDIVLYHSSSCETLEDSAIDLLDYCNEAIIPLCAYKYQTPNEQETPDVEIRRQKADLEFDIGVRAVSILRYFAEYLDHLPLSVSNRMVTSLDIPLLFTQLITNNPWIRKDEKGFRVKYIGGKWVKMVDEKLSPTEAQVWIGLRELLLHPRSLNMYEITDFRKNQLMKLQLYLNDFVIDQLSPLIDLKQYLCQLSMSNLPPRNESPVLLEILPQIKETILHKNRNKWKDIAREQVQMFFKKSRDDVMEIAKSLSESYNFELMEKFEEMQQDSEQNVCGGCGGGAVKKCSRCKQEWYCGRNCQVKHWPQHKEICDNSVGCN